MPEVKVINPTLIQTSDKKRVAAYCRVSSDSSDQLNSFIAQVNYYSDMARKREDIEIVDIYADEGLTGTRADKREEFQRMLRDCRKGKIDKIMTKSISRFSRNTVDCLTVIRELKNLGISVFFEKENLDTATMSNEILLSMMGCFAQEESMSISRNMKLGCRMRMKRGTFTPSSVPYGYRLVNKKFSIDQKEAEIVKQMFDDYLNGHSTSEIARELNKQKIYKTADGQKWNPSAVNYILTNEKYIGDCLLQKSFQTDALPFTKQKNKGELDRYYVQNTHEAIISKEEYETVKALMQKKGKQFYSQPTNQQYPLYRVIVCGECGHIYQRKTCNGKTYWVCYNHAVSKDNCSSKRIPEQEIYLAFVKMVNKLKANSRHVLQPLLSQLQAVKSISVISNSKICDIDKKLAELNEQNLIISRLKSKGFMDDSVYIEKSNELNKNINELRTKRRRLLKSDDDDNNIENLKCLIALIEADANPITEFDKQLFESTIKKIVINTREQITFCLIGELELSE
jgi:site-specific DNA recombinase